VPLDYSNPSGQTITIAVSKIPAANPATRRGVLLFNPGGPGGSGLFFPAELVALGLPQSVLDTYDLIGFDPRGIGESTPVTCNLTAQQADQAFPLLAQSGGFSASVQFAQLIANGCASASTSSLLPYMTTANTAQDMDQIRQGLGDATISYYGVSYGTYLGAVYASLFPQNTDRFILDSNVDPQWVWQTQFRDFGPGGALRFPDFANYAAANNSTYGLGSTPAQVTQDFFTLESNLEQNPQPLTAFFTDGTSVNGPVFQLVSFSLMYFASELPEDAGVWQELQAELAASSTSSTAVQAGFQTYPAVPIDNGVAGGLAVVCDDVAWPTDVSEYQSNLNADSAKWPMYGSLGSNIQACAFWPNQPVAPLVQISSVGPRNILMLQNERDLATTYTGALQMHTDLGHRSRLVSVDEGGHGVYVFNPNTCANDAATAYLVNGTFPSSDVLCPANPTTATAAPLSPAQQTVLRRIRRQMTPLRH
jgi:pimeloyl-ACP methyl ester carboxylesterase